ncbi:MAG TPA: hypothetical protein VK537_00505 [Galbitalea sp.]|nr:hypothetical protein [Galbitalea sp.]
MTTTTLHPVDDFARAVRAALSDLPADEVEDLTDGLEADLAERASDEESPDFGDPVVYANDLRSAAGLPPRSARRTGSSSGVFVDAWHQLVAGLRELSAHPLIARLATFFVALRPLWWLFRGWVLYGILAWLFDVPSLRLTPLTFCLGLGTLIVSVQFGRGKWQPRAWMRNTLLAVNIVLVFCVPLALLATSAAFWATGDAYASSQAVPSDSQNGLQYNGHDVTNIFAYDADGKPLTDVQLFDQHGKPLDTVAQPSSTVVTDYPYYNVPNKLVAGRLGWNVYPLLRVSGRDLDSSGLPIASAIPLTVKPKNATVPPLGSPAPSITPSPTATRTAPPTNSPAP